VLLTQRPVGVCERSWAFHSSRRTWSTARAPRYQSLRGQTRRNGRVGLRGTPPRQHPGTLHRTRIRVQPRPGAGMATQGSPSRRVGSGCGAETNALKSAKKAPSRWERLTPPRAARRESVQHCIPCQREAPQPQAAALLLSGRWQHSRPLGVAPAQDCHEEGPPLVRRSAVSTNRAPRRPVANVARWTRPEQKEARYLPAVR
jgi:hypothetical protein